MVKVAQQLGSAPPINNNFIFFFPSTMSRRRVLSSTRNFTTTAKCHEKPILNRYSRIVTQPKDQGASQV